MKSPIITAFFIAILLFISFHFLLILSPFTTPILFAGILAFTFYPLKKLIVSRIPSDTIASLIVTLLGLVITVPALVWAAGKVNAEGDRGVQWLTDWIRNKEYIAFIDWIAGLPVVDRVRSTGLFESLKEGVGDWATRSLSGWGSIAASQAANLTKNVFLVIVNMLLTVFFFFIFLKDGRSIIDFVYQILPMEEKSKRDVMHQLSETFTAVIHGQMLASATKAVLVAVAFWVMGLPLPALFGALTFVASLLPIVGAAIVWFPFVMYLASQNEFGRAAALLAIGAIVISSVDNIIQPLIIGQRSGLPYALILIGVIGGVSQYGVFGIFIGPVVMSLFFALIKIYRLQFIDKADKTAG